MTWSIWILMLAFLGVAVLSAFLIKHRMSEDSIATWAQITTIIGGVAVGCPYLLRQCQSAKRTFCLNGLSRARENKYREAVAC
jgi:membrane associated rhomboid family serine protease